MYMNAQRLSLTGLKRETGLTFRRLGSLTGMDPRRAHRGITDPSRANRGDVRKLRRALKEEARLRRSSDPEFLRQIQQVAVPFLSCRAGIPMPAGKTSPDARTP